MSNHAGVLDAYVHEVSLLWPSAPAAFAAERPDSPDDLLVVPSASAPRMLVPVGNRRAAARSMLRFSAGLTPRDTAQRLAVAGALNGGAGRLLRGRVRPGSRTGSLLEHLSGLLGADVVASLSVGPARANRKPVLQVFDDAGRSLAFVKVGTSPTGAANVAAEASALHVLGQARFPRVLALPTLIDDASWRDYPVLAMTALPTSVRQRPSRQFVVPESEIAAFTAAFDAGSAPLVEMPWWSRTTAAVDALPDGPSRDLLRAALARLAERSSAALPVGAWHGDWTPWNMARSQGRLQLWDFERFETGVPQGLDLFHYAANTVVRRDGLSVASVTSALDDLGASSGPHRLDPVAACYLVAIVLRYAEQAGSELGAAVADRLAVFGAVLAAKLDLPVPLGSDERTP